MKTRNIIIIALAALLTTACYNSGFDEPTTQEGQEAYGNQKIKATNLKTIADLKQKYSTAITSGEPELISEPLQIQGVVIGNDEGGNVYNSLYIKDASGAMCINIKVGGLYAAYPIGQSIMLELKGLHIGNYGSQPQIGIYSISQKTGNVQIYGMSRYQWMTHHKIIDKIEGLDVTPVDITASEQLSLDNDCNKLVRLKGVELASANGTTPFADPNAAASNQSAVNQSIKVNNKVDSKIILRTSCYAKFAMKPMPTGKVDITGVASYFNGTWQILMRTEDDIQAAQ
jgi:hypothetical protein